MKKVMIAVAIVCAAVMGQAATANWAASASGILKGAGAGGAANLYSGDVYYFDAAKITQEALFTAFAADTTKFDATKQAGYITTGVAASGTINSSTAANKFGYGDQTTAGKTVTQDMFFAIVLDDKMYTSTTKSGLVASGTDAAVNVGFGNQATGSMPLPTEGFVAAGKWAQAVPEPTSGLLLLLGMAGLALRRRHA